MKRGITILAIILITVFRISVGDLMGGKPSEATAVFPGMQSTIVATGLGWIEEGSSFDPWQVPTELMSTLHDGPTLTGAGYSTLLIHPHLIQPNPLLIDRPPPKV